MRTHSCTVSAVWLRKSNWNRKLLWMRRTIWETFYCLYRRSETYGLSPIPENEKTTQFHSTWYRILHWYMDNRITTHFILPSTFKKDSEVAETNCATAAVVLLSHLSSTNWFRIRGWLHHSRSYEQNPFLRSSMSESQQPQNTSDSGFSNLCRHFASVTRRIRYYKALLMPVSLRIFYVLAATELVSSVMQFHVDIRVVSSTVLLVREYAVLHYIHVRRR